LSSSKSRKKKGKSKLFSDPYSRNVDIDSAIKDITKVKEKISDGLNADLINLFKNSHEVINQKLQRKLQIIRGLRSVNKAVNLSKGQEKFLFE